MWQSSCISNAYLLWCYHEFERFTWWSFYLPLLQFIGAQPWNRHDFALHRWFRVPFILCTQVKLSVVLSRSASSLFWFNLFTSSQAINHHTHRIKKMHVKHFIEQTLVIRTFSRQVDRLSNNNPSDFQSTENFSVTYSYLSLPLILCWQVKFCAFHSNNQQCFKRERERKKTELEKYFR